MARMVPLYLNWHVFRMVWLVQPTIGHERVHGVGVTSQSYSVGTANSVITTFRRNLILAVISVHRLGMGCKQRARSRTPQRCSDSMSFSSCLPLHLLPLALLCFLLLPRWHNGTQFFHLPPQFSLVTIIQRVFHPPQEGNVLVKF